MQTWNSITLVGRVINPETRSVETQRGAQQVTAWSMAQNDPKDRDNKDKTTWFKVTAWGRNAEIVEQYCCESDPDTGKLRSKLGAAVGVVGELSARKWTDRDGNVNTSLEVRVERVTLMNERTADDNDDQASNGRPASSSRRAAPAPSRNPKPAADDNFDDIPF